MGSVIALPNSCGTVAGTVAVAGESPRTVGTFSAPLAAPRAVLWTAFPNLCGTLDGELFSVYALAPNDS